MATDHKADLGKGNLDNPTGDEKIEEEHVKIL
jgi:hypothetical protein